MGDIRIAFQVLPSGRVAGASATDNTTGSDTLARCLIGEISSWTFAVHVGEPIELARPFRFRGQ